MLRDKGHDCRTENGTQQVVVIAICVGSETLSTSKKSETSYGFRITESSDNSDSVTGWEWKSWKEQGKMKLQLKSGFILLAVTGDFPLIEMKSHYVSFH